MHLDIAIADFPDDLVCIRLNLKGSLEGQNGILRFLDLKKGIAQQLVVVESGLICY
jgi:hypothetical protein